MSMMDDTLIFYCYVFFFKHLKFVFLSTFQKMSFASPYTNIRLELQVLFFLLQMLFSIRYVSCLSLFQLLPAAVKEHFNLKTLFF